MHIKVLAKRAMDAQRRTVAAATTLALMYQLELPGQLTQPQKGTEAVKAMKRNEGVADFLEMLVESVAASGEFATPLLTLAEYVAQASDEEILALPGVGQATLAKLREGEGDEEILALPSVPANLQGG